jgi:hypothetical protein
MNLVIYPWLEAYSSLVDRVRLTRIQLLFTSRRVSSPYMYAQHLGNLIIRCWHGTRLQRRCGKTLSDSRHFRALIWTERLCGLIFVLIIIGLRCYCLSLVQGRVAYFLLSTDTVLDICTAHSTPIHSTQMESRPKTPSALGIRPLSETTFELEARTAVFVC